MGCNQDIKIDVVDLSGGTLSLPKYAKVGDAGMDVMAYIDSSIFIAPGKSLCIPTGIKVAIPKGFEIQVRPRSGLAFKQGITVLNSPGTIDSGYRNEIGVILINHGTEDFQVEPQGRIAQIVLNKVPNIVWNQVDELDDNTVRGQGGFGSTGC